MTRSTTLAALAVVLLVACGGDLTPTPEVTPRGGSTVVPANPTNGPTPSAAAPESARPTSPTSSPAASVTTTESPVPSGTAAAVAYELVEYDVPRGTHPHDVAVQDDGIVWYTGQNRALMGRFDPTGEVVEVPLDGAGSAPHGVIIGPDGGVWVTDQGANTIVRVDPTSYELQSFEMPNNRMVGPHTPTFDGNGTLWFTGANGFIGRLDSAAGEIELFDTPRGAGPYGIDTTPGGEVWYANLSQNYLATIDQASGESTVFEPPTPNQGARRVWSDSTGRLWISEWNSGQLSRYDPTSQEWREWPLPASNAQAYAIYVDDQDQVWVTDFGSNTIVRFDPATETFEPFVLPSANAQVRQLLGRPGEVWGAESATDKLVVIRRV